MDAPNPSPMEALTALNTRLLEEIAKPLKRDGATPDAPEIFKSMAASVAADTQRWAEIQNRYYQKQLELWAKFVPLTPDTKPVKVVEPEPTDRRFKSPE